MSFFHFSPLFSKEGQKYKLLSFFPPKNINKKIPIFIKLQLLIRKKNSWDSHHLNYRFFFHLNFWINLLFFPAKLNNTRKTWLFFLRKQNILRKKNILRKIYLLEEKLAYIQWGYYVYSVLKGVNYEDLKKENYYFC